MKPSAIDMIGGPDNGYQAIGANHQNGDNMERFDAIILGGGISGMTAASVLKSRGVQRVILLDEYSKLGGNHISHDIGPYTFDIGSFLFHDGSPFLEKFPEIREKFLPFKGEAGRLDYTSRLAQYPFDLQRDFLARGPVEITRILFSLLKGRLTRDQEENANEFVCYWLGERLAQRTGLLAYLKHFYSVDPALIEGAFARKRMRWVSSNASLNGQVKRLLAPRKTKSRSLVRPRAGFDDLYRPVESALRGMNVDIRLGETIRGITRGSDGSLTVKTAHDSYRSPAVYSTVPIDVVSRWCGLPDNPGFRYTELTSLFYSFDGDRSFPYHILYNFSDSGRWKRLTMHSDCYGTINSRLYFTVEVMARADQASIGCLDEDFRAHARRSGILRGDLVLEGATRTSSAYPVYMQGASAAADETISALKAFGILSFGRQGGFDYQPTAHVSTVLAERYLQDT